MRRVLGSLCLSIVVMAATTVSALAARPERAFAEAPPTTDYEAGEICAFPVRIETPVNKGYSLTFEVAADGTQRMIVTGRLGTKVTNLDTNEWLTANVSGPGVFTFAADGTTSIKGGGPWLLYLTPTDVGGPGMWLTFGRLQVEVGETSVTAIVLPRNSRDVCEMLAA